MSGRAAKVVITERQQEALQSIVSQRTAPQCLVQRAQIILLAFEGRYSRDIGKQVGLGPDPVGVWRKRWQRAFDRLVAVECSEGETALRDAIVQLLCDAPRSGAPRTFFPEQVSQIIAVACEDPEKCGRPVTHWTPRELKDEVMKRRIVVSISTRQVGRFLKSRRPEAAPVTVLADYDGDRPGQV